MAVVPESRMAEVDWTWTEVEPTFTPLSATCQYLREPGQASHRLPQDFQPPESCMAERGMALPFCKGRSTQGCVLRRGEKLFLVMTRAAGVGRKGDLPLL